MTRLTQVVANLLNNAAKYTPSGRPHHASPRRWKAAQAVVRVSDTGIGIPAEQLPEVFEMFAQVDRSLDARAGRPRHRPGAGQAPGRDARRPRRGRERRAGAGQSIRSAPAGRGRRRAPPREAHARPAASPGQGAHILIADDNRDSADSLAIMLGLLGFRTTVVYDGEAALRAQGFVINSSGTIVTAPPTNNCKLPASQVYDPVTNPNGPRCGDPDLAVGVWGTRAGHRNRRDPGAQTNDNVGVQYGLNALLAGAINPRSS